MGPRRGSAPVLKRLRRGYARYIRQVLCHSGYSRWDAVSCRRRGAGRPISWGKCRTVAASDTARFKANGRFPAAPSSGVDGTPPPLFLGPARARNVHRHLGDDPGGRGGEEYQAIRQANGFPQVVGDEQHRMGAYPPDFQQQLTYPARVGGSRETNGSSISNKSGSTAKARAMAARRLMPRDKRCG